MGERRTRKQKVLDKLVAAMGNRDDGWVCCTTLQHPSCGGRRFDARLSELRSDGWRIERQRCVCEQCRYRGTGRLHAWRLDPDTVPF